MTWVKKSIRNLLFAVLAAAFIFSCTGCFSAAVLNGQFGAKTSRFDVPKYAMSPDRREIIITSAREIRHHYLLPRRTAYMDSVWDRKTNWEEHIPLVPMPDSLMRCFLIVEPDPDAQRYWHNSPFVIETGELPLNEDRMFHLRVHPDELDDLSRPFQVKLISPNAEESGPAGDQPELRMMFPVGVYGNMYVLLTAVPGEPRTNPFRQKGGELSRQERREKKDVLYLFSWIWNTHDALLTQAAGEWDTLEANRYLYPFRNGMDEVRMAEYERIFGERFPTWDAILLKAVCLPSAIVADTLLLPANCVIGAAMYLLLNMESPIQ